MGQSGTLRNKASISIPPPPTDRTTPSATLHSGAWMIAAGAGWTVMTVMVRELSVDYSAFKLLQVRNVVAVALLRRRP